MAIYNIEKILKCIVSFIEDENIKPILISLTLIFGSCEEKEETPELIVGMMTRDNYKEWLKEEDFIEYILNQAEYKYQEILHDCFASVINIQQNFTREDYIAELIKVKEKIRNMINDKLKSNIMIFAHDLDNFDYDEILDNNFTKQEKDILLSGKIC